MVIKVCVGSSCHLKGSYDVIEKFKEVLKKYDVEEKIELQASFCLGHCSEGVTTMVDEQLILDVNKGNVEEIFTKEILPKVNK